MMLVSSVQPDEKTSPRRTLRRAAGLFAAALLLGGAVRAEPAGDGVEQWSGNKKVTPSAAPRAVVTEPGSSPAAVPAPPREGSLLPPLTATPLPEARPDPVVVPLQIRPTVSVPDGVVQTGGESSATPGVINVDIRVRPEAITPPAPPAPPAPATTVIPVTVENKLPAPPPPAPTPPAPEWYEASWVPLAILGAGCVFIPSLIGLGLLLALRKSGVLLRVEVVNSGSGLPTMAYHPAYAAYGGHPPYGVDGSPATAPPTSSIEAAGVEEGTAMAFDLGPTYEEEQAANAEAARALELAVLQRVFEDNMRLREDAKNATDADFAPVEPAVLPLPEDFAGYESPSDGDCPAYVAEETPCDTPCEQTCEPAEEPVAETSYVVADEPPCEPAPAGDTAECVSTDEAVVA